MMDHPVKRLQQALETWQPPQVPPDIPQGDMPGDKVWIGPQSIAKGEVAFRAALPLLVQSSAFGFRWQRRRKNLCFRFAHLLPQSAGCGRFHPVGRQLSQALSGAK